MTKKSWRMSAKVVGDHVLPALSGYGEDGVHSREAADKTKRREDWKKLIREHSCWKEVEGHQKRQEREK